MWELSDGIQKNIQQALPSITYTRLLLLVIGLLLLRSFIQKILAIYFQISQIRPHHQINTLEYSYFYHLSVVILVMVQVDWNMFDLAIWIGSYIGVGFIRRAIHIVRIEKDLILSDCNYNRKITQILSASKIFGLILFLGSISYILIIHTIFECTSLKLGSLLLFPTLMLTVDSIFLLISSHISQKELLIYYNQNINNISSSYKVSLLQKIIGNSVRIWHYLNVFKLFFKNFLQRQGILDRLWIISVINALYMSSCDLYGAISRYRGYNSLLSKFNKIFKPTSTAPDQTCVICMSELLNCRKLAPCGHLFHYKCLFEWVQTKSECPVCRAPINIQEQQ